MLAAALCCASASARKVSGTVSCGGKGLARVIVTDGTNFTRTDSRGVFRLKLDENAEFVSLVTPSGYVADWSDGTPEFYKAVGEKLDFELQQYGEPDGDYTLVAMADPQVKTLAHFGQFSAEPLADLVATCREAAAKGPVVGIALGDIAWDTGMEIYPKYTKAVLGTGAPFYTVIGNHDYNLNEKGDDETAGMYRSFFGPENYAFMIGGDCFIGFDSMDYDTKKKYVETYSEAQLVWLKKLLAFIPKGSRLWIGQHCPLFRRFYDTPYIGMAEEFLAAVDGYEVIILDGHTHFNNNTVLNDHAMEHNIAAMCGTWWETSHCSDGTPGGYKVFEKRGGELSWYYKAVGHDRDFQYEVFGRGECSECPESVAVNVWDWDPEWSLEWKEDGVAKGKMEQVEIVSPLFCREFAEIYPDFSKASAYKRPQHNNHYFAATPSEGACEVTLIIKNRFGKEWRTTIEL